MKTIKSKRIFYKPKLHDHVFNNWHKVLIVALLLTIVGKILAHGFRIAA